MDQKPTAAEPEKPRRRWFQFRLRTLLIGVMLLGIPCWYVGEQVQIVRERQVIRDRLRDSAFFIVGTGGVGSQPRSAPMVSWLRQLLGDSGVLMIQLRQSDLGKSDAVKAAFPESELAIIP